MEQTLNKYRADYLKECMSDVGQAPIDVFQKAFCRVCANRECARSAANNLMFDIRVANWKKDLFDNVPRANDSDPKFAQIRAKRFYPADQPPTVILTAKVQETSPISTSEPLAPIPSSTTEEPSPVIVPPIDSMDQTVPLQPFHPDQPIPMVAQGQSNTPFSQGTVLPGFKTEEPSETEIEVGGSFSFSGGEDE